VPELFSEVIKPEVGFRAALGYEFRNFRFAVETGHTHIEGTNPFVLNLAFTPLTFKFGYALPIRWGLGLQADLTGGVLFSQTVHYTSAIGIFLDNKNDSPAESVLAGARLYATFTVPRTSLKFYAGGGLDAIFENDGPIPLPLIEAGISIKPLAFIRPKPAPAPVEIEPTPEVEDLVFDHTPENIVIEEDGRDRTVRFLNAVYFVSDSVTLIESYRPVLEEAGRRLREDPSRRIVLRGYSAPFGTEAGRVTLSAARVWYCADYLMLHYGVAEEMIQMEFFGADKVPELTDASWESWRCVELIIE
jgi:outer membrane protein OmpA-like peptidoglycan-associated protein